MIAMADLRVLPPLMMVLIASALSCTSLNCTCQYSNGLLDCSGRLLSDRVLPLTLEHPSEVVAFSIFGNALQSLQISGVDWPGLRLLNASRNQLERLSSLPRTIRILDVSGNRRLGDLMWASLAGLRHLAHLHMRACGISSLPKDFLTHISTLLFLDLSENGLTAISVASIPVQLEHLDLNANHIDTFAVCRGNTRPSNKTLHLRTLDLSRNAFVQVSPSYFSACLHLQNLRLTGSPSLLSVDQAAFNGLDQLKILNLSGNSNLHVLPGLVGADLSDAVVDLSYCALKTLGNISVKELLVNGNRWHCDCALTWMTANVTCSWPDRWEGKLLSEVPADNVSCVAPKITSISARSAHHSIGSSAVIDCLTEGIPPPVVEWVTPRNVYLGFMYDVTNAGFHDDHPWHDMHGVYEPFLPQRRRMYLLTNGSLYIEYVSRHDGGHYRCTAQNVAGHTSMVFHFRLDYSILRLTTWHSMMVGVVCAASFLTVSLLVAAFRYTMHREKQKQRKGVREILESLNLYKSEKIDQLNAFRTAKVDKLRSVKKLTGTTVFHYMTRTRDHYNIQVTRIKCNVAAQLERSTHNYKHEMSKFRKQGTNQLEKIREQYQSQTSRVRDLGANQLERLRDQYRQQQQYVVKLVELLDVGNCLTPLEAECMRVDSVLFEVPDLNWDLEEPPKQLDEDCNEGLHYDTASSDDEMSLGELSFKLEEPDDPPTLDQSFNEVARQLGTPLVPMASEETCSESSDDVKYIHTVQQVQVDVNHHNDHDHHRSYPV